MNRGNSTIPVDEDWETGDEIDWRYYWSIINRRKWSIIGLALAVGLLTTLVAFAMTPIYRASSTLLIESQPPNVVSIQEVYGLDTRSQDYLATQVEIMGGRPIAETVVDRLGLIEQPAFRPQHDWQSWLPGMQKRAGPSRQSERESAIGAYLDRLSIEPVRNTQLVRVEFESPDPGLAARVAEAHAKAYIESTLEARADATRSATEWMATRVESLRKELQPSEASLQAYREQEQIIDVTGLKALPAAEISNLSARLLEVRQTLASAKIAYLQVTPVDGRRENLLGVPALLADEGMRRTQAAQATAQQTVAELEKRYGSSHPKMIAAQSELAQATENLNNQAHSVTEGSRKRYEAAESEEDASVAVLSRAGQQDQ